MDVLLIFALLLIPYTTYCKDYKYNPRNKVLRRPFLRPTRERLVKPERTVHRSLREWLRQKKEQIQEEIVYKTTVFRNLPDKPGLNMSVFSKLRTEQKGASVKEEASHWIARVMHSPTSDDSIYYLCTAVYVEQRIFVTAARCIYQAKVLLTAVVIEDQHTPYRFQSIAFVVPPVPSKTMFDDIGFIIVDIKLNNSITIPLQPLPLYDSTFNPSFVRTDENFFWFTNMFKDGAVEGQTVGYVKEKDEPYAVYEIDVYISPYLCQHFYNTDILRQSYKSDNYFVPCYHTCDLVDGYNKTDSKCNRRLAGEGHAVLSSGRLIGIATWGGYYAPSISINLPVGLALINSLSFVDNLDCARKITRADPTINSFSDVCSGH